MRERGGEENARDIGGGNVKIAGRKGDRVVVSLENGVVSGHYQFCEKGLFGC